MNESKILRIASDEKWYAQAYGEYLADVAETTSNLMGAIQEVLGSEITGDDPADMFLEQTLKKYGINPQARFIVPNYGSIQARELCRYLFAKTGDPDTVIPGLDVNVGVEDICSTIRDTWTQAVISSKAFFAYLDDYSTATERGTKFIQDLQSELSLDDTVRDTFGVYQEMINKNNQVSDFLGSFLQMTGVNDMADGNTDDLGYYNSELATYTGNTPALALDFSTANKIVNTTVTVAAKVVKGVFSAISSGASWLFNKVKKYVVEAVIDPAVAEYIGSSEHNEGYLDGFAWFGEFTPNVAYSHMNTGAQIADVFRGFADEYATKWVKLKLKTGEILFKIVEDEKWQTYFKPVAIDVQYLKESVPILSSPPEYRGNDHNGSIDEFVAWLNSFIDYVQPVSKDADKYQLVAGFACATELTQIIAEAALYEVYTLVKGEQLVSSGQVSYGSSAFNWSDYDNLSDKLSSVTNADLIVAAAGNPARHHNLDGYITFSAISGPHYFNNDNGVGSMRATITDLMTVWALCRIERRENPTDYTFIPYSNNHSGFTPASWRVKSDAAIAATRDDFVTNAVIAAVVIAVVLTVGVGVKKISKNLFFKRQQTLGQLENKMWNGGTLTSAERRKYIKYNRRQSASKLLSSGIADSGFSLSNDSSNIVALIQG